MVSNELPRTTESPLSLPTIKSPSTSSIFQICSVLLLTSFGSEKEFVMSFTKRPWYVPRYNDVPFKKLVYTVPKPLLLSSKYLVLLFNSK